MQWVKTLSLIRELPTDGHSPLLFLCDDMASYYCKFRSGVSLNPHEIDCLFYEIVSSNLLKKLDVPCPELAIVQIQAGSFDKKNLYRHKRFCTTGQLYLGSKEIIQAEDLHGLSGITNKRAYNRIVNPYDLLRICIFDLWVDNCDRGRMENYNLLISHEKSGKKYYAFDHAFCFGGVESLRSFNEMHPLSANNKLVTSSFFKKILPYLNKEQSVEIINNLLSLPKVEIEHAISESYKQCPEKWAIPQQLQERMVLFLTNEQRILGIKTLMWSLFK